MARYGPRFLVVDGETADQAWMDPAFREALNENWNRRLITPGETITARDYIASGHTELVPLARQWGMSPSTLRSALKQLEHALREYDPID